MVIRFSDPSLLLLIGPSGSGKSTFAKRHFLETEVLSSDRCRALVCDDENEQRATDDAFELLHMILDKRLQRRRTTVVDATNVQVHTRAALASGARQHNIPLVALMFVLPEDLCQARNIQRISRRVPADVIRMQIASLRDSMANLAAEGFESVFTFRTLQDLEDVSVVRENHS